jgi:mercuric ion transport protein
MTKIKAYVAGVVAFITCPCHLPITLPLLISLTAGTAFGAWLAAPGTLLLVGAISTVIFIGGLALAFKWSTQPACATWPTFSAKPSLAAIKARTTK